MRLDAQDRLELLNIVTAPHAKDAYASMAAELGKASKDMTEMLGERETPNAFDKLKKIFGG